MQKMKEGNDVQVQLQETQRMSADLEKKLDMMLCREARVSALTTLVKECRKRGVAKNRLYGCLVDLVEMKGQQLLNYAVDLACGAKLFSLVVEDEETANKVVEINKDIKGGKINVYPL